MKTYALVVILLASMSSLVAAVKPSGQHSWGIAEQIQQEGSASAVYRCSFSTPLSDKSDIPVSSAKHILYFALRPGQELHCSVLQYQTATSSQKIFSADPIYVHDNDSSIVRTVMHDAMSPLRSTSKTTPEAIVKRYEWYRGYYIACVEVPAYLADAQANAVLPITSLDVAFSISSLTPSLPGLEVQKKDGYFDSVLREMIINYDEAVPYEHPEARSAATSWFIPTARYMKMAIGDDGLYRLTYQKLQTSFPEILHADPRTIQLYKNGVEIPLFISGESDGVFDPADYIEFPARKNYTDKHRIITTGLTEYNEYLNRYSDSTIYWLTYGITNGRRMDINPAVVATADTLRTYTDFRHFENNAFLQYSGGDVVMQQNPLWTSHDVWGWTFLNANGSLTSTVSLTDIALNGDSLRVYAKLVSWGANIDANAHSLSVRVDNGADLGLTSVNRFGQAVITGAVSMIPLKDKSSVVVGLYSWPTAATTVNSVIPDWIEVEYPRLLKAVNDSLLFEFRSLSSRGLHTVQITNFSSPDIAIYKIKPNIEKISNVIFSATAPYSASFVDTVGPQEQYIAIANNRPLQPFIKKVKQFSNINSDTHQTDYLIVTNRKFKSEADQYGQFVAASRGMTTRVVDVEDIFDEYGYGYATAESMRDYFQSALSWNAPMPAFLFLMGDATYDYKFVYGNKNAQNYVPSFGYPVSDAKLVTFDSLSVLPQMYVGRLPVNNTGEATSYLNHVQTYVATPNSEWNKRYLFFTGGDPAVIGQVESFKTVNDYVLNNYIRPAPVGGEGTHFYKTVTPQSDFGPYTSQQVKDAIAYGGVFISYIGHSGTQTWDNSIGDPVQLQNTQGKFSLISDFGCSTGKFAEPQVTSFSELFVIGPAASAIGYIGNSSLGFTTIATQLPQEFYKRICRDSIRTIGKAHLLAKVSMALANFSAVNNVMLYTNTLIGDPALDIAIPNKPNLVVKPSEINTPASVTEASDSVAITINMWNYGSVISDSVDLTIEHRFKGELLDTKTIRRPVPTLKDSILYYADVKGEPGEHILRVTADPSNCISEISKSDNTAQKSIYVLSTNFRLIQPVSQNNGAAEKLLLLNPVAVSKDTTQMGILQIDTTDAFTTALTATSRMDLLTTEYNLSALTQGARYWWRAKSNSPSSLWTTGSFYQGTVPGNFIGQSDSLEWGNNLFSNVVIQVQPTKSIAAKLQNKQIVLQAISSGTLDGSFGTISINGSNLINNSYGRGHSILVLDTTNYTVIQFQRFDLYGQASNADSLVAFINRIPAGSIVAVVIIDEGANNFSTAARNAYSLIGAQYANSVSYRSSWAVIGKKGGAPGTALEMYRPSTTGKAIVETTFTKIETSGSISTPEIGPVAEWKTFTVQETVPPGAKVTNTLIGIRQNGATDTVIVSDSSIIDLKRISAVMYPKMKLRFDLQANASYQSPVISSWSTGFTAPAELATNLHAIRCTVTGKGGIERDISANDSVLQGEKISFHYRIYNLGEASAKNFTVRANSVWDNNNNELIANTIIDSLASQSYREISADYNTSLGSGRRLVRIAIDPDTLIRESYKDNNIFAFPIYVKKDSSKPLLPNLFITDKGITPLVTPITDESDSVRFAIVYGNSGAFINDSITVAIRQYYKDANVASWIVRRKYPSETDTIFINVPILKRAGEHHLQVELDPVGLIVESSESDNSANYYFTVATTDFKILQPTSFSAGAYSKMIFLNPTNAPAGATGIADLQIDTAAGFTAANTIQVPMQAFTTTYDISTLPKSTRYYWRIKQEQSSRDWTTGTFYLGESAVYSIGQADSAGWGGNTYVQAAYSGASGARIADTRTTIRAFSAGFSDGRTGAIEVNGLNFIAPIFGTGHNVVVIDTNTYSVTARRRFDISDSAAASDSLTQFIAQIASGALVVDVVVDDGSNNLLQTTRDALKTIGSAQIDKLSRRDSWAIIGRKGAASGTVPESYVPQFSGRASIETTFVRKEYNGTITTTAFGPLARLSSFSMTGTIPPGTSIQTRFIGLRFDNRIDTVLLTSGNTLSSSGIQNSVNYKEGTIVFSLQASAAANPSITSWKLSAMPAAELAISAQTASISRSQVMQGEPIVFNGTIHNVSSAQADSVTVQLSVNESGFDKILKQQRYASIAGYDSAAFTYTYSSKGKSGSYAFTMTIDPADSLIEESKDNNIVSIPFVVAADTVRPQIQIMVDGQFVLDGDYVRQNPEIVIRYTDNNPSAITSADTSNFRIQLNNQPVYFTPGTTELLPSTTPGQAQLKWSPTLPGGENAIQVFAVDVAGNSSDTTTLFVNVSTDFVLRDIYNLPNPFAGSTAFTFNLLSPVNPDEVSIKIFTVAGRLIQDLTAPCRIGFNKIFWDGRDKDGDEIANGVYFYKVIVKQGNQQTNGISKLVKMR